MASTSTSTSPTSPRLKFSEERDIALLREFIGVRPYDLPPGNGWKLMAANLVRGGHFPDHLTSRACRDRAVHLFKEFGSKDTKNRARSGIEEVYSEKDELLIDCLEIKKEAEAREAETPTTTARQATAAAQRNAGIAVRDQAMIARRSQSPDQDVPEHTTPVKHKVSERKRTANQAMMDFLISKEENRRLEREQEYGLRKEEMDRTLSFRQAELDLRREEQAQQAEERRAWLEMMKELITKK